MTLQYKPEKLVTIFQTLPENNFSTSPFIAVSLYYL